MEKNKSIDGLAPRRSKNATTNLNTKTTRQAAVKPSMAKTPKQSSSKQSSPKRSASPKSTAKKITVKQSPVKASSPRPKAKSIQIHEPTPQPLSETEITENFLKPTQVFNFDEQSGELTASEEPSNKKLKKTKSSKKEKKAKKPMSKKRKVITTIIIVLVLLLVGAGVCFILWGNDIIAKITGGQGNVFDLLTFTEPTYERLKTDENGRTNILAFGTSGYNMDGDEGNGTHDGAQLTDSIMAISLNQDTGDIAMISLPRDLKASPTCTATGKINEIYWCNGGKGGANTEEEAEAAQALMNEVGTILNIDFQYFAHLNWGSLIQIVDTLGGINVTLDEGIYDYNWTGAVYEPGIQYTINGEQALGLARARHGTTGGDFSRGASQQKILIGIKDKVFEKDLSLTDILGLASALGDNLRTNFSLEELKSLAHLTSEFDLNSMRNVSLYPDYMTTGSINGISYVLPRGGAGNYASIQDYVAKMTNNDPRVYEEATILVLNATETPYLASNEQTTLEEEGYSNITADNAPTGEYPDDYTLYVLDDSTPGTKKMLEEKYSTHAKSYDELSPEISHNYNFVLILGPSPSAESDN
ncbi:LCP family protein [Candidatus Saccharibacteria bacterium]|nr:LCP family protein [Candidatus Saccharibacteria bacterium]